MPARYEYIVVGLGAMGSAVTCCLASRGQRVLAFDRFRPPHVLGSSHGDTRAIREAYFEHPIYVPLVQRAYELWSELEQRSGATLLQKTGGLMMGAPESDLVRGAMRSAREHGLAHELLDAAEIRRRFPVLEPPDESVGVFEARAGILFPERCISVQLRLASEAGANLRLEEQVLRWEPMADGVRVVTQQGVYHAGQLIVTAGPWINELFPELRLPVSIERQILCWFEAERNDHLFHPNRCPIHIRQFDGRHFFYGFPDFGEGIKVARHHDGATVSPDTVDREVSTVEIEDIRDLLRRFLPSANGRLRKTTVCLYTNTPDEHFWIDRHPSNADVLIVSACSGHGFKFATVIGEIVADLMVEGSSRFDLSPFAARSVQASRTAAEAP